MNRKKLPMNRNFPRRKDALKELKSKPKPEKKQNKKKRFPQRMRKPPNLPRKFQIPNLLTKLPSKQNHRLLKKIQRKKKPTLRKMLKRLKLQPKRSRKLLKRRTNQQKHLPKLKHRRTNLKQKPKIQPKMFQKLKKRKKNQHS